MNDFFAKSQQFAENGIPFLVVTLVHIEGHVPQNKGAKALVSRDGLQWGTIGGGRLEARAIEYALRTLTAAADPKFIYEPELIRYDLQQDLNMVCGGAATIFYELYQPPQWNIAVFGAGHVAQATIPLLASLRCQITCFDPRPEWLEKLPTKPNLKKILASDMAQMVPSLAPNSYCVVMTQGHVTDLPIVRAILQRGFPPYLGVIGSAPKSRTLRAKLLAEGFADTDTSRIISPIGLSLGSNDPAEIAISIAAQLLQVRDEINSRLDR